MILAITGTILKLMLVVILIGVMILILMGINCAIVSKSQRARNDSAARLREDLKSSDRVIPRDSVFHPFLARDFRRKRTRKHSHSTG